MAIKFISDPGHGWLRVELSEYPDALESASGYGYWATGRKAVYLEEDLEASDFLERHPELDYSTIPHSYVKTFDRNTRACLPRNLTFDQYIAKRKAAGTL